MEDASVPSAALRAQLQAVVDNMDKGLTDEEFFAKCLAYAKPNCVHCHGRGYLRVAHAPANTFREEACSCAHRRLAREQRNAKE